MPNISTYLLERFGIVVYMYFGDTKQHHRPHIHVFYSGEEAVIEIPSGVMIEGSLANRALRKVRAWIELNDEALMERWEKAARNEPITRID